MDINEIHELANKENEIFDLEKAAEVAAPEAETVINAAENTGDVAKTGATAAAIGGGLELGKKGVNKFTSAFTLGSLFIIIAFLVNIYVAFNGFGNIFKPLNWSSLSEIRFVLESIYALINGGLLVLSFIVGFFVIEKKHAPAKLLLGIVGIFYVISLLPPALEGYFALAGFDILIFVIFMLDLLRNPTKGEYISLVIFISLVYSIAQLAIVTGSSGAIVHLIVIVFFYLLRKSKYKEIDREKGESNGYRTYFIYFLIINFFLTGIFSMIPSSGVFEVSTLPFLTLGMIILVQKYEPTWFSGLMFFAAIMWCIASMGWSAFKALFIGRLGATEINVDEETRSSRWNMINPVYWFRQMDKWVNDTTRSASGQDYYASQVDENAKKKLGVYIEEFGKNEKSYSENERIIMDATITAENFASDEEDYNFEPIQIDLNCKAYKSDKEVAEGEIYPNDHFEIETYDIENIRCSFEPWQLEKGSYEIRLSAKFNFRTDAYLKRYFVLKETINSLRRKQLIKKDEEILKLNKIDDINPVAMNSVAPVEIKVSDRIPSIIKLDRENVNTHIFRVELVNKWTGKIERIKNIQFFVPEQITLENFEPFHMEEYPVPDSELYGGYKLYQLPETEIENSLLKNTKTSIRQSGGLVISPSDIDDLLQPGDVTTRYFRMIAAYDYILEEKLSISIKEPEGFNIRVTAPDGKPVDTSSKIECELRNSNEMNEDVVFTLYENNGEISTSSSKVCVGKTCEHRFDYIPYEKGAQIKCRAQIKSRNDGKNATATGYAIVRNTPPKTKKIRFEPEEVNKGETLKCSVDVEDPDSSDIIVQFNFEGLNIASTQKDCPGTCSVEIPTDGAEKDTTVKCFAIAYDEDGDKSEPQDPAQANIIATQAAT